MRLVRILLLSFLLLPLAARADDHPAIPGEFVISNPGGDFFQAKTVDAIEKVTGESLAIAESNRVGIRVKTKRAYANARTRDVNVCNKLRIHERETRKKKRFTQRFSRHCEPNYIYTASVLPNDPMYSSLWGFERLQMQSVWDKETGNSDVVVAVIDTGIDYTHPDLAANIWTNPNEIPGNGIDDDGNGIVDDIHGANFVTLTSSNAPTGDPKDDNGHGTHCAGTIGASANNSIGVAGINWNVKMMGLKFMNASGSGSLWSAAYAISYANYMKEHGVNLILTSNSWGGGGYSSAIYQQIQRARTNGLLFVAAAGNKTTNMDVSPDYPASYDLDNIVSVAAIDNTGNIAYFSNYGATTVDIGAPGYNIASTYKGSYSYLSGTSMAAPHVSGALALLFSYSGESKSASELRTLILSSASPNSNLAGKTVTGGELNILGAMSVIDNSPANTPRPTSTPTFTPTATSTPTATPVPPTPTFTPIPVSGSWTLRVVNDLGTGVSGVSVTVTGNGASTSGVTAADGTFNIATLPGGNYTATFAKSGYTFQPATLSFFLNGNTISVVSAIRTTYQIKGVVLDRSNANPVQGASVLVYSDGNLAGSATSAADGTFALPLPYGATYRMEVRHSDFYPEDLTGTVLGAATRTAALTPN